MSTTKRNNPTSDARMRANRANAARSTGPKTRQGKAISSRNALKHGLLADKVILLDESEEERDAFGELLRQFIAEHKAVGPTQRLLVERIAICYWRLRRVLQYEADCIHNDRVRELNGSVRSAIREEDDDTTESYGLLPTGQDFNRLIRYETMIDRQLNKLMDHLDHLQQTRLPLTDNRKLTTDNSPPPSSFILPPSSFSSPTFEISNLKSEIPTPNSQLSIPNSAPSSLNPSEAPSLPRGEARNEANPGQPGEHRQPRPPAELRHPTQCRALGPTRQAPKREWLPVE